MLETPLEILDYLIEIGADEALVDLPVDRTQAVKPVASSAPAPTSTTPVLVSTSPAPVAYVGAVEAVGDAQKIAAACNTLDELQAALNAFEGCVLKRTATNTVFCDGNPASRVMLVGEVPGADEDRLGKPFVGETGELLDKMFSAIGMTRATDFYVANLINWRPPGNRSPSDSEMAMCLPFTRRHIELVNPKMLIYIGGAAAKALAETTQGINQIRGKWTDYTSPGLEKPVPATAIFHPGYLLKNPAQKALAWADLLRIKEKLKNL